MQPLQDQSEHSARRDPATAQHADLEIGSGVEMPILQEGTIGAARAYDQVDGEARDHTVCLGDPDNDHRC